MIEQLSHRENEVAEQVARGFSVKEIASNLFLSPYTVDTHIKKAKKKMGVRSMVDIAREFILSLDHPKQFFRTMVTVFFLSSQIFMIVDGTDIDLRKPSRTQTRTVRASRTRTRKE